MLTIILGFALKILEPIALSAATALVGFVGLKIQNHFHSKAIDDAYKNLSDGALIAAKKVGATTVAAAKKAAADGKLPAEIAKEALKEASAETVAITKNKAVQILEAAGVDTKALIPALIEGHVADGLEAVPSFVLNAGGNRIRALTPTP